jgi:predicted O-methyltransferase YrrM
LEGDAFEAVDRWICERLVPPDPVLEAALADAAAAGLPPHDVSPPQGKLLNLLARSHGARLVLEVGTLAGYSTIWLARALPPGGRLVTLELNPAHAEVARGNLSRAGLGRAVEVRVGDAAQSLEELAREGAGPFDLVFLDADKRSNPEYLGLVLELARPGTLIVADNVVRGGVPASPEAGSDPNAAGIRRFMDQLAADPRVDATAIQTVGAKGWDGFVLALVTGAAGSRSPGPGT